MTATVPADRAGLAFVADVSKSFGGVHALRGVSFELRPAEVHSLVGENGAGKSTLMNLLSGVLRPDSGQLKWRGEPVNWQEPSDAQDAGVGTVYQELDLIPSLSVAENVMLGDEPRLGPLIGRRALRKAARRALDEVHSSLDLDAAVGTLSLADQQRVAIARAVRKRPEVLILDEPTTPLGPQEVKGLFVLLEQLRRQGMSIVFISHRLEEVLSLSDRITVLRDGQIVGERSAHETSKAELIRMMSGRDIATKARPTGSTLGEVRLRASIPAPAGENNNVEVRAGEVVGIAGLAGAGRSRLLRSLVGAPWAGGLVEVDGTKHRRLDPARALAAGMTYLPEDRKHDGLILDASLELNASLSASARDRGPRLRRKRERTTYAAHSAALGIKGTRNQPAASLSGGNQQKVLLARVLAAEPNVLLLDEPTRGVDIRTKEEIWSLVDELAARGVAVLVASSELPEIFRLASRVLVMREGAIVAEFDDRPTEEDILHAALPDDQTDDTAPDSPATVAHPRLTTARGSRP